MARVVLAVVAAGAVAAVADVLAVEEAGAAVARDSKKMC